MEKQDCSKALQQFSSNGDMLDALFNMQKRFAERFHPIMDNISAGERDNWSRVYLEAITHECGELREELRWKSWKQYPEEFKHDVENIRFEIADIMCFLMDLALVWGVSAKELFEYTMSKQLLNVKRQEDKNLGYIK